MSCEGFDYDKLVDEGWFASAEYGPTKKHQRRVLMDLLNGIEFASALEIGCGEGTNLKFLDIRFPGVELKGVDISKAAIEVAEQRLPGVEFEVLDAAENTLSRGYDLTISWDVVEHVLGDQAMLDRIFEMTNTGGHLVICTVQGRMRDFEPGIGHVRNYRLGELEEKCENSGFSVVKKIEWGFPFYSPLYRNFLNAGNVNNQTFGKPGLLKRLVGNLIYLLFIMNSSRKGDCIFLVCQKEEVII